MPDYNWWWLSIFSLMLSLSLCHYSSFTHTLSLSFESGFLARIPLLSSIDASQMRTTDQKITMRTFTFHFWMHSHSLFPCIFGIAAVWLATTSKIRVELNKCLQFVQYTNIERMKTKQQQKLWWRARKSRIARQIKAPNCLRLSSLEPTYRLHSTVC